MFGEGDRKRDETLTEPEDIEAIRNLAFDEHNRLDVYYPKGTCKKLPVIVNVHGGAYVYGSKEVYKYYGMFLAQQGFVFVNANYRLAPEHHFPMQLTDICRVFQWISENQNEYYMDTDNVFIVGDSAGAQMASQLGVMYSNPEYATLFASGFPTDIKVRAMALNCGMYDLLSLSEEPYNEADFMSNYIVMESYLGSEGRRQKKMLDVYGNITADYPPCFIMTSYYDFLKDYAKPFYEFLREKGIEAVYHLYGHEGEEYMGHVFHCNMNLTEAKQCDLDECNFFRQHISQ